MIEERRFGPIWLAPGVMPFNVVTKLYAGFVCIGMLAGMNLLQGYILMEHLHIPRSQLGVVAGNLAFWAEVVALFLISPFGILSDRIGRRPVLIFGILMIGLAYGVYPFATSVEELLAGRVLYGIGLAAAIAILPTITNDYPQDRSRGKLIGFSSMLETVGVFFVGTLLARIPSILTARGVDAITAGRALFLLIAGLGVISAIYFRVGLQGGTPVRKIHRKPFRELLISGFTAARNPRIVLSYMTSFTGRSDLVIKALFLTLWAIRDGRGMGLNPGQALARFGIVLGIMQFVSLVWQPVFGWIMDRVSRVTAVIIAMFFASTGYLSMYLITSPLDFTMMPAFVLLQLGSSSAVMASIGLLGQEAPLHERGAIMGMAGLCGAAGILMFSRGGGIVFDAWGPWAPFVVVGSVQLVLLAGAFAVRIWAPGPPAPGRSR